MAKKDDKGNILGIWGAMSDFSRSFHPWQNGFRHGLYLAGVECSDDAETPKGWTKWLIPAYEYLYVENEENDTFSSVMDYLQENNIPLVGAAPDEWGYYNENRQAIGYMGYATNIAHAT